MLRRDVLGAALAGGAMLGGATGSGVRPARAQAKTPDKVSVQLDWIVRGTHAMFFVAKAKGYFAAQNIDVTAIRRGTGSGDALRLVGNGNAEFGFADMPTLLVARSQTVPVVALAVVNQNSTLGIIALKKTRELKKPDDVKGLHLGVFPAGSTQVFLRAFFATNNLSFNDVKQSTMTPPYENFLLLERVQAVPGYTDGEVPELAHKAGGDDALSMLMGSDWGYKAYGSGMFTSERVIAEKPDLVQRFTTAFLQGFRDVVANPEEAAKLVVAANSEFAGKEDIILAQLHACLHGSFRNEQTKAEGLGWNTRDHWDATAKILLDQSVLPAGFDVGKAFDNRFVAAAERMRA